MKPRLSLTICLPLPVCFVPPPTNLPSFKTLNPLLVSFTPSASTPVPLCLSNLTQTFTRSAMRLHRYRCAVPNVCTHKLRHSLSVCALSCPEAGVCVVSHLCFDSLMRSQLVSARSSCHTSKCDSCHVISQSMNITRQKHSVPYKSLQSGQHCEAVNRHSCALC